MSLRAGRLRHRIIIQEQNLVSNGRGGFKPADGQDPWRPIAANIPAEVLALRGDEAVKNLVERAVQLWRVTIRPRADVTPTHRLVWKGITMNIKSAALSVAGDELVMTCASGETGR
jgi:head-tail adaptor